ncbi:hypothetical protein HU200_029342 [Digitaria exilis]|uniref:Uncharacterized protein n=1 Tax=Digitaria exilis TaxID=1010633 RepID=A0A835C259_9POAL|nr:hypothetical protein HU200_029342 [Digitaria exilis]
MIWSSFSSMLQKLTGMWLWSMILNVSNKFFTY